MSMRNVLGVLEDRHDRLWSTLDAAVDLAEEQRARLTLVKTCEPSTLYLWASPFAVCDLYLPADGDQLPTAERLLARAAASVPGDIPLTTLILGPDTRRQLCRLVRSGAFDAVVGADCTFRHARRLTRELRRLGVRPVPVRPEPGHGPEAHPVRPPIIGATL